MTDTARRIPRTGSAMALATRELIQLMLKVQPGDLLTYAAILDVVGVDVQQRRDIMRTARTHLRMTHGKEFDVDVNIGLYCLHDYEKIGCGTKRRHRTARYTGITGDILGTVDQKGLTPLQSYAWLAEMSTAQAVFFVMQDSSVRAIETQGAPQPLLIDPRQYAGLFETA